MKVSLETGPDIMTAMAWHPFAVSLRRGEDVHTDAAFTRSGPWAVQFRPCDHSCVQSKRFLHKMRCICPPIFGDVSAPQKHLTPSNHSFQMAVSSGFMTSGSFSPEPHPPACPTRLTGRQTNWPTSPEYRSTSPEYLSPVEYGSHARRNESQSNANANPSVKITVHLCAVLTCMRRRDHFWPPETRRHAARFHFWQCAQSATSSHPVIAGPLPEPGLWLRSIDPSLLT